jgi:hypothetical protein
MVMRRLSADSDSFCRSGNRLPRDGQDPRKGHHRRGVDRRRGLRTQDPRLEPRCAPHPCALPGGVVSLQLQERAVER